MHRLRRTTRARRPTFRHVRTATIVMAATVTAVAATAMAQPDAGRCFAWARDNTGIDPAAEASRPVRPSSSDPETPDERSARFSRAYRACLASDGYEMAPPTAGYVSEPPSVLVVGVPIAYKPATLPVSVVCDDTRIVRVDDAGTFLWLSGMAPGETDCSFGDAAHAGRRRLYHFVVRAASR